MAGTGLQPTLIALLYLFPAISILVLAVRFWRKRIDRTLGLDDALILIAWLLALGNSILTHIYALATYAGYHIEDVPVQNIDWIYANKLQYALSIVYNPVIGVIKASFMCSLQRLRSRNVWIVRSLWGMQIFNVLYMIGAIVATIVPCVPIAKKWETTMPGHCYSPYAFVIANVSIAIITDAIVLIIPTWMIYDLQMTARKKMITIAFLSLGAVVVVIGILRLVWLSNIFKGIIHNYSVESAYSAIESNVAIIGTSGPTVKYIFATFIPALRGSMQKKGSSNNISNNYGTNSSRQDRSHRMKSNAYGDLDSDSIEREEIEMKGDWRWRNKDSDTHSDEQRITDDGIVKTVDWTVSTTGDAMSERQMHVRGDNTPHSRPPVQPATAV